MRRVEHLVRYIGNQDETGDQVGPSPVIVVPWRQQRPGLSFQLGATKLLTDGAGLVSQLEASRSETGGQRFRAEQPMERPEAGWGCHGSNVGANLVIRPHPANVVLPPALAGGIVRASESGQPPDEFVEEFAAQLPSLGVVEPHEPEPDRALDPLQRPDGWLCPAELFALMAFCGPEQVRRFSTAFRDQFYFTIRWWDGALEGEVCLVVGAYRQALDGRCHATIEDVIGAMVANPGGCQPGVMPDNLDDVVGCALREGQIKLIDDGGSPISRHEFADLAFVENRCSRGMLRSECMLVRKSDRSIRASKPRIDRRSVMNWLGPNPCPTIAPVASPVSPAPMPKGKPGRPKDTGLGRHDRELYPEMNALMEAGDAVSAEAAARQVAHKARGDGTWDSKVDRLAKGFRSWKRSIEPESNS